MMPNLDHEIYAIMLNWNQLEDTTECITSLKLSTLPVHIVVVDQASEDGSGRTLKEKYHEDDHVHVILNRRNVGFAEGMNIGMRLGLAMGAEMTFLINNDTIVDSRCVELLCVALQDERDAAAAGPAIFYHSNPDKIWLSGGYFSLLKMGVIAPGKNKKIQEIEDKVSRVTFLTGCAILIPRHTLDKVGFLDSSYFFYIEDIDYSLRIQQAGMTMCFVPRAKVWHKIDDIATDRTSPYVLYHIGKSSILMLRKRFSFALKCYGVTLQFVIYTPYRIWQIIKGRGGWESFHAWMKGLCHGLIANTESTSATR